jgi:ribosomal protein S27AE
VAIGVAAPAECEQAEPMRARAQPIGWARVLERVFDIDLRRCPRCGAGELKIIAAILQRAAIGKILTHLRLDPRPPPRGRAREAGHAGHTFAPD